ncbi:MAG: lipid-A-disaccharide synthase, partial [Pseudolabrys sp.]
MSRHIFLVAGEESGDRLGAALIAALRQRTQGQVRVSGVGGAHMIAEGVPSLFPLGDLAIMGFT